METVGGKGGTEERVIRRERDGGGREGGERGGGGLYTYGLWRWYIGLA